MNKGKILKHGFKLTIVALLCVAFMFSMTACGDKESKTSNSDTVSKASSNATTDKAESTSVEKKSDSQALKLDDVAFKTKDGKLVKFGAEKAEIEKVLGQGKENLTTTYGQLSVVYRNDVSENIAFSKDNASDESQFTVKGIKLGDKKSDVVKVMGALPESMEGGTGSSIEYYFKIDGDNIKKLNSYKEIKDDGNYFAVIFAFNISSDEGKVTDNSTLAMITEVGVTPDLFQQ